MGQEGADAVHTVSLLPAPATAFPPLRVENLCSPFKAAVMPPEQLLLPLSPPMPSSGRPTPVALASLGPRRAKPTHPGMSQRGAGPVARYPPSTPSPGWGCCKLSGFHR